MDEKEIARFWSKVERKGADECWPWTAKAKAGFGYGAFRQRFPRRTVRAHRFAYEAAVGPIGALCVLHKCDNPACCNPAHLFLGTRADNNADMCAKGRYVGFSNSTRRGEANNLARLTAEDVLEIRVSLAAGGVGAWIAAERGIAKSTVSAIRTRRIWRHI